MTNAEAIEHLKNIKIYSFQDGYTDEAREALDMAIKALEAQPEIVRCTDCRHLKKWRSEESAKKFGQIYECVKGVLRDPVPEDFCSRAERRT